MLGLAKRITVDATLTRTIEIALVPLGFLWLVEKVYAIDNIIPDLKAPEIISAGHDLYVEKHCSHCHGVAGEGGVNLVKRELTDPAYVFEAIADGRERGGIRMPAWREVLSDQEIWQVTAYVLSMGQKSE